MLTFTQMEDQTPKRAFRDFAPEIREMIYNYCLRVELVENEFETPKGNSQATPVLLAALRGEPALYFEVLHLFYKENTIIITFENFKRFRDDLSHASLRSITKG